MLYGADGNPISKTPSIIGLDRKSLTNPSAEDLCIQTAVEAHVGCNFPLPVVFGRKIIGYVEGKSFSNEVRFTRAPAYKWWCAFSTYDDIINALTAGRRYMAIFTKANTTAFSVANNWYDLFVVGGLPTSGTFTGAASTAVQFSDTTTGALYHGGNVSTQTKHVLSVSSVASANTPTVVIYDRVLTYEANVFNAASNKAMTNSLTAQRYVSTGQSGMKIMCTVQTLNGSTAANLTQLRYTNQAGTTLQSVPTTVTMTFIPSAVAPTSTLGARVICPITSGQTLPWGPYIPLAAGDGGARLINDFTTSAANSGTFTFTLARPLFTIGIATAGVMAQMDGIYQIASLEQVFDGACLSQLVYVPATTAMTLSGSVDCGWN